MKLTITYKDQVKCLVNGLTAQDKDMLYKEFSVFIPSARYQSKYKLGMWNGMVHYFTLTNQTYVNLLPKIFEKLDKMNVRVCTALQLSQEHLVDGISALGQSYYWANETEMTGCAGHYMKDSKVDGMITLTAFGCGPDSLMLERITRKAKEYAMPLLNLTIDEHTGEAGFVTRLEAFVDMLFRKQRATELQKV